MKNKKIFISYAQKDEYIDVSMLEDILKKNGYEVFRDKGILEYGDHHKPIIKRSIEQADYMLLIMTPYSITRPWVIRELYEAVLQEQVRGKKVLIPFIVGDLKYTDLNKYPILYQWIKTDPFYIIHKQEYQNFEDLLEALDSIENKNTITVQNYSILPILDDNLDIYRTNELVGFGKNENLKYVQTVDSYFLYGYDKGVLFKHFVLCNVEDRVQIKNIISRYSFAHVAGDGSPYPQEKWLVWFLDTRFEITSSIDDPYCNNMEKQIPYSDRRIHMEGV